MFATMGTQHLRDIGELAARGVLKSSVGLETQFADAVKTIASVEKGLRAPAGRVVMLFPV